MSGYTGYVAPCWSYLLKKHEYPKSDQFSIAKLGLT